MSFQEVSLLLLACFVKQSGADITRDFEDAAFLHGRVVSSDGQSIVERSIHSSKIASPSALGPLMKLQMSNSKQQGSLGKEPQAHVAKAEVSQAAAAHIVTNSTTGLGLDELVVQPPVSQVSGLPWQLFGFGFVVLAVAVSWRNGIGYDTMLAKRLRYARAREIQGLLKGDLASESVDLNGYGGVGSTAATQDLGRAGTALRSLARHTGKGICTVEVSDVKVTGVAVGGEAYTTFRVGGGSELSTEVVGDFQEPGVGPVLQFNVHLQFEAWRYGGPLVIVVMDRRVQDEEPVAWVEVPSKEILRSVLNESEDYVSFELALGGSPPGYPASYGEALYGTQARISMRLQRVEVGPVTAAWRQASNPRSTLGPALESYSGTMAGSPAGADASDDEFDEPIGDFAPWSGPIAVV